jgi:NAD(P)-dependent dehydrogenase (short-subunit alcohol dehydrogenase family)
MDVPTRDEPWSVADMVNQSPPVDCSKPYDTSTLAGKTILITGGASGFGAAFARHRAQYGAHLIIGDVRDRAGEALVAELRALPTTAPDQLITYQHCDVTSWTDQLALFNTAISLSPTGTLSAVVAGAGIVEKSDMLNPSPTSTVFDLPHDLSSPSCPPPPLKVLAVNLTGVMYTTHLALYHLPRNPADSDRHLLLISSIAGVSPLPGQTEYTASKHAVMGLFRSLRGTAWMTKRVRVNVLAPYFVDTPLLPAAGMALLAGGAKAELEDVVDAGTRLMADEGVRGRALVVGPKMRVADEEEGEGGPGVRFVEGERAGVEGERRQAVWEVYGHDYERVEVFVWRYLNALNLMRGIKGWIGMMRDLWGIYGGGGRRQRR